MPLRQEEKGSLKKLNFYPFYENYLKQHQKTTTFRLSKAAPYKVGDEVMISVGWSEEEAIVLNHAIIKEVHCRRICDLEESDFEGESPDCKSQEAAKLMLSCIYKKVVKNHDSIWIVKFDHKS
jgi:hypothetical protein